MGAPRRILAELSEGEAAAIADVGIVHAELMTVVAERERLDEVAGQRLEAAEMRRPPLLIEFQPHPFRPAPIEEARHAFGKHGRLDRVIEIRPELEQLRVGAVGDHRA